ncbi:MAG: 30S ribosomal protein S4 [Candidatus Brockarchaeota archaeon]|nr:30S ribosomal protein S4 [Candidatus Brockarchaeota archaeon]
MGDPRRIRSKILHPKHPWVRERLAEELILVGEYGLRNKRELWRAASFLRGIRASARSYLSLTGEERIKRESELISRLYKLGLVEREAGLDDVLSLNISNILERRLQTIVYRKGLAKSIHAARQAIVHGKIMIGDQIIRSPSYFVKRDEEPLIRMKTIEETSAA